MSRTITMIDGLKVEQLEHIETLLHTAYFRAVSKDDADNLLDAVTSIKKVINKLAKGE